VRLQSYKAQGAKSDRAASLQAEIDKLALVQSAATDRCQVDAGVAKNQSIFESNLSDLSSNANGFLLVTGDANGDGGATGATRETEARASGANWAFNDEVTQPDNKAVKKDIVELKERMQSELQRRGDDDRRKSVNLDVEGKSRADASRSRPQQSAKQEAVPDEATVRFDENRNNALLNDRLRVVQSGQQLRVSGGTEGSAPAVGEMIPDSSAAAARIGLMGVDVPLPKDGRAYWFVGARAGSALQFDASPDETPTWRRFLLALALFAALGFALFRIARRRARRARRLRQETSAKLP
jgi:hypothetical protein